jgi:hypothetical protein
VRVRKQVAQPVHEAYLPPRGFVAVGKATRKELYLRKFNPNKSWNIVIDAEKVRWAASITGKERAKNKLGGRGGAFACDSVFIKRQGH